MAWGSVNVRRAAWVVAALASAAASAVSLNDLQPIQDGLLPTACDFVYQSAIQGCAVADFAAGDRCSATCKAGIKLVESSVMIACDNVDASSNSVLGFAQRGVLIIHACFGHDVTLAQTTSTTSTTSSSTTTTFASTSTTTQPIIILTPSSTTTRTIGSFTTIPFPTTVTASSSSTATTQSSTISFSTTSLTIIAPTSSTIPSSSSTSVPVVTSQTSQTSSTTTSSSSFITSAQSTAITSASASAPATTTTQGGSQSGDGRGSGSPFDTITSASPRLLVDIRLCAAVGLALLALAV